MQLPMTASRIFGTLVPRYRVLFTALLCSIEPAASQADVMACAQLNLRTAAPRSTWRHNYYRCIECAVNDGTFEVDMP